MECDISSPDVRTGAVQTELIELDEADGRIHVVNAYDRRREASLCSTRGTQQARVKQ